MLKNRREFLTPILGAAVAVPISSIFATSALAKSNSDFFIGGNQSPSIVLIHGLGADIEASFAKIAPNLANLSKTCAFNRKGYGKVKYKSEPRNGIIIAQELRQLLQENAIAPPYILIGHSLGGVYAQFFARLFPQETTAMILIDPAIDGQSEFLQENYADSFALVNIMMAVSGKAINSEFKNSKIAYEELNKLPKFAGRTHVLMADRIDGMENPQSYRAFRQEKLSNLARAHNCELKIVQCGHFIQKERPQEIVEIVNNIIGTRQV